MEQVFFSKQNFNIVYNIVKKKINQEVEYDIDTDKNFNKELISIMKTIYANRKTFKINEELSTLDQSRYLSQKVINISIDYFKDIIKKKSFSKLILINKF